MKDKNAMGFVFAIAGLALCFLVAVAAMVWDKYAPGVREFLLWAITPQFAMGMMFMALLTGLGVISMIFGDRR